jgi:hypothetical protein
MEPMQVEEQKQQEINRGLRQFTNQQERARQAYDRQRQSQLYAGIQQHLKLERMQQRFSQVGLPWEKAEQFTTWLGNNPRATYYEIIAHAQTMGFSVPGPIQEVIADLLKDVTGAYEKK